MGMSNTAAALPGIFLGTLSESIANADPVTQVSPAIPCPHKPCLAHTRGHVQGPLLASQWKTVFTIAAMVSGAGATFYAIFARGEVRAVASVALSFHAHTPSVLAAARV